MNRLELEYLANLHAVVNRILKTNIIGHESARPDGQGGFYDDLQPFFMESKAMVEKSESAEIYFRDKAASLGRAPVSGMDG